MKRKVLLLSLASALAAVAGAASAEPLVQVLPKTSMAWVGHQTSVAIIVNADVVDLMGWDVTVRFDPACVSVDSIVEGPLAAGSGQGSFFFWLNEGCGCDSLCVNGSVLGSTVDGPGTLFRIYFTATNVGVANIGIARSDLRDGDNARIAHNYEDGILIVTAPTGTPPSALPAGELTNWPNPFNPVTEILLSLPGGSSGETRLAVYAPSGRRVRELFSGSLPAGAHRFTWDGRDGAGIPSAAGVYIAVAETPRGPIVRKLVIVR